MENPEKTFIFSNISRKCFQTMKQFDWLTSIVGNCRLFVDNDSLLLLDDEVYNALSLHGRPCYISAWTPLIYLGKDAFARFPHGRLLWGIMEDMPPKNAT